VDGAWKPTESLGGSPVGSIGVAAWAVDQLEVFAVFPDGELWDRFWDGTSWHPWESLGGDLDPEHGRLRPNHRARDRHLHRPRCARRCGSRDSCEHP
jgi:hypothetical protein